MTTSIRVHVNGRYKATVVQKDNSGVVHATTEVFGNYAGSPNPSGEHYFGLYHPAQATFEITEEAVAEEVVLSGNDRAATEASQDEQEPAKDQTGA